MQNTMSTCCTRPWLFGMQPLIYARTARKAILHKLLVLTGRIFDNCGKSRRNIIFPTKMPHINVDVVGHSFVKGVKEFGIAQEMQNLALGYDKVSVHFKTRQGASKILKISDVASFTMRYEVNPWCVPDFTYILSGSNDIQNYLRDSHRLMDNDEMMGGVLALQLMAVVDRMKQAGVPLVLVGGALPRTGGGTYGAAAFLEDPSGAEMLQCQERSVTITSAFNQKLQSELWVRQGVQ